MMSLAVITINDIFMILFRLKDYKIEIEMQLNDIKKMIEDLASKE